MAKLDLSRRDVVEGIPADRDKLYPDAAQDGLYVRVQRGTKSWVIRYTVDGVKRQKTLPLTQTYREARDLARELRLEAKRGRDVVAERREELAVKRAQERASASAAAACSASWSTCTSPTPPTSCGRRPCGDHAVSAHGAGAAARPRRRPRWTSAPWRRCWPPSPRSAAGRRPTGPEPTCPACLSFGVTARHAGAQRADRHEATAAETAARPHARPTASCRAVWQASDPATDFGAIVRLLMLLGQRREEVGAMRWSELDLAQALWRLPAERTKNNRPHDVPLPAQAVAILAARRRTEGRDAVFGRSDGESFSGWSKAKVRLDAAVSLSKPWVVHDLRRTAVTGMAEIGIEPHIIEAVVNHVSGHKAGVAGIYNGRTYSPEKTRRTAALGRPCRAHRQRRARRQRRGVRAMSAAASDDPYDTGHVWRVDDFAAQWRVDAGELRRALNLCAFSMRLTIGDEFGGAAAKGPPPDCGNRRGVCRCTGCRGRHKHILRDGRIGAEGAAQRFACEPWAPSPNGRGASPKIGRPSQAMGWNAQGHAKAEERRANL